MSGMPSEADIDAIISEYAQALQKTVPKAPEASSWQSLSAHIENVLDDRDEHDDYSQFPGPWIHYWFSFHDDASLVANMRRSAQRSLQAIQSMREMHSIQSRCSTAPQSVQQSLSRSSSRSSLVDPCRVSSPPQCDNIATGTAAASTACTGSNDNNNIPPIVYAWDMALDAQNKALLHTKMKKVFDPRMDHDLCGAARSAIEVLSGAWLDPGARSGFSIDWVSHVILRMNAHGISFVGRTETTCSMSDDSSTGNSDAGKNDTFKVILYSFHVNYDFFVTLATRQARIDLADARSKFLMATCIRRRMQASAIAIETRVVPAIPNRTRALLEKESVTRETIIGYWFVTCTPLELSDRAM